MNRLQYLWIGIPLLLTACNSDQISDNKTIAEPQQTVEAITNPPVDTPTEDLIVPESEMEAFLETEQGEILPPPPPPPPPPPTITDEVDGVLPDDFEEASDIIEEVPESEVLEETFRIVEEMPIFPGCDSIEDYQTKKTCGDQKMLKFISNNINYPPIERSTPIEGMAVIGFVVNKEGRLENIKVVRNPGGALGKEAARVVELMNTLPQPWIVGKQRGVPVKVQMHIPIRFKVN